MVRIIVTAEGTFLKIFGRRSQGRGELNWPCGVAIDSNNLAYVSEGNHRVSVFTSEGRFVVSFGKRGQGSRGILSSLEPNSG